MRFTPKSEAEIEAEAAARGPFPPGVYSAEIVSAEEKKSSKGNDMIEVILAVFNDLGEKRTVYDWLMEQVAYKLKHAAQAAGLEDAYNDGDLSGFMFEGKTVQVQLAIDKTGQRGPQNRVRDYVVSSRPAATPIAFVKRRAPAMVSNEVVDDDIPF